MPLAPKKLSKNIVDFAGTLTDKDINTLLEDEEMSRLQCNSHVSKATWQLLNDSFFSKRPDVTLRVWGYTDVCDLSFASLMTNVRHFSANSLHGEVTGVNHIADMPNLLTLRLGIYRLEKFDVLNEVPDSIQNISLSLTKSKKPSLSPLARFKNLKTVYLEGQQKDIAVLSELAELEDVTFHSISTDDLSYLAPLKKMWSLDIKLGGIKNLDAISGMDNLKYLELWQIRGLEDIGVISNLFGLQYLFLQSLRRVKELPSFEKLTRLRRILLQNMKGLTNVKTLQHAPALEEFLHSEAMNMQPNDYIPLFQNQSLKRAVVGFGSKTRNKEFQQLLEQYDIEYFERPTKFQFN